VSILLFNIYTMIILRWASKSRNIFVPHIRLKFGERAVTSLLLLLPPAMTVQMLLARQTWTNARVIRVKTKEHARTKWMDLLVTVFLDSPVKLYFLPAYWVIVKLLLFFGPPAQSL